MVDDTIAAIATPFGEGGVGIVRISGPEAIMIAEKVFRPAKRKNWNKEPGYRMFYGHVVDPVSEEVIDEVLLALMRAPHSYTREDVVEISGHGGLVPLRKILKVVLAAGARLAEPGEFTKRAFLNGRLDLAQAEAVIDIIRAQTEDSLRIAVGQLEGKLSRTISAFREELVGVLAYVEAAIDFPEDEVPGAQVEDLVSRLRFLGERCEKLRQEAEAGRVYREGVATAIVGKPNVGKSSLLNALARNNRAIVTDIPGTTRDVIEEVINIRGVPFRILDTAGLRETQDAVEKIGVARAKEEAAGADLVITVLDASSGIRDEDKVALDLVGGRKGIVVINKCDVAACGITEEAVHNYMPGCPVVRTSLLEGWGVEKLEDVMVELVLGGRVRAGRGVLISNIRHQEALERARLHLREAADALENGLPVEMVAIDIREALEAFGNITGDTVSEEILDRIFSDFCIGK
ncbi:MAG: tRNA uridine-5-carboxymethylaminomethyl(34) synthesis GTPase MnmE [Peptococcaceae bacterium]|nr:tRNA uridine-5-carboxymethylaminomethyl(34) synthesis GTPase MnmE [Peptococcaceae bacterium]